MSFSVIQCHCVGEKIAGGAGTLPRSVSNARRRQEEKSASPGKGRARSSSTSAAPLQKGRPMARPVARPLARPPVHAGSQDPEPATWGASRGHPPSPTPRAPPQEGQRTDSSGGRVRRGLRRVRRCALFGEVYTATELQTAWLRMPVVRTGHARGTAGGRWRQEAAVGDHPKKGGKGPAIGPGLAPKWGGPKYKCTGKGTSGGKSSSEGSGS